MQEYGFSLTRTLPYKARNVDSVLIPDNTGQFLGGIEKQHRAVIG